MMVRTFSVICGSSIHFPVPIRICLWKRAILVLGLTPVRYTLTTLRFTLVHSISIGVVWVEACGFSPRINIRPLNTCSPRVITCLLRLCRNLLVGAHNRDPRLHTHPPNTYSPWVTTRPLHPHSHRIVIRPLCPRSHRTAVRPLWGGCTRSPGCLCRILRIRVCNFNPRVTTRLLSTYSLRVNTHLLHPTTIGLSSIRCVLTAIGLSSVRREVSAHRLLVALFFFFFHASRIETLLMLD